MQKRILFIGLLLLAMGLFLSACAAPEAPECPDCPAVDCPEVDCPAAEPCPEAPACPDCPEPEACPEAESVLPGIEAAWSSSGHADSEAEALNATARRVISSSPSLAKPPRNSLPKR